MSAPPDSGTVARHARELAGLPDSVLVALRQDLPRDVIRKVQGNDYVSSHYVITRLNDVFGFDGWRDEYSTPTIREGKRPVVYVTCTLHAGGTSRTDVGVGIAATESVDAFETAIKAAYTDGLKRCARTFGASFGLALYEKERTTVGLSTVALAMVSDIEALESLEDVNGWVRANAPHVEKLDPDEQNTVKGTVAGRRRDLTATPAPAAVVPAAPVIFRRFDECTTAEELCIAQIALWPGLSEADRGACVSVRDSRAEALGIPAAALAEAGAQLRTESRNAQDWRVVADAMAALRRAPDAAAIKALVSAIGPKVSALPKPLKDRLNAACEARLKALVPRSSAMADALIADAGRATTPEALQAIYRKVEGAMSALSMTPDDGTRVCDALNERASVLDEARAA